MLEQAQLRQEELEKLKKDQEDGQEKRLQDKKKLYNQQIQDQNQKKEGKQQRDKFYGSESWQKENILSYFFEPKAAKSKAPLTQI